MSRIDYSKWDNIECSEDDEEEISEDEYTHATPQVTRLEQVSTVTIGQDVPTGECVNHCVEG